MSGPLAIGNTIVVESDSPERFNALGRVLKPFGYTVMDPVEAEELEVAAVRPRDRDAAPLERLPRLVHCMSTAQTIASVQALVAPRKGLRGLVDVRRCCALLDRAESVDALEDAHDEAHSRHAELVEELVERLPAGEKPALNIVCTAVLYDDLLRQVRDLTPTLTRTRTRTRTLTLYDDLLRQVREWARLGHSPAEIQAELDARFARVAGVLGDVSFVK